MSTLNKLLDKAREMCVSDADVARRLGLSRSAVSVWRQGGKITPAHLARLIEFTQQDPALAVQVLQEQDAEPAEVRLWGALWDRLSPVTTRVAGVLLLLAVLPPPASASPVAALQAEQAHKVCIMRSVRRILRRRVLGWIAAWRIHAASPVLA